MRTSAHPPAARSLSRTAVVGTLALGGGLGALAGLLWAWLAPRVLLEYFNSGPVPEGYQDEGYISSDGIAALLLIGVGLLLAAALVLRWPDRPLRVLGLGVAAALLSAIPMWLIVRGVHAGEVAAFPSGLPDGALVEAPRNVRMPGVYVLGAVAVALIVTVQAAVLWIVDRARRGS